jgi:hypothetical protein
MNGDKAQTKFLTWAIAIILLLGLAAVKLLPYIWIEIIVKGRGL